MRKSIDLFAFRLIGNFSCCFFQSASASASALAPTQLGNLLSSEQQVSQPERGNTWNVDENLIVLAERGAFKSEKKFWIAIAGATRGWIGNQSVGVKLTLYLFLARAVWPFKMNNSHRWAVHFKFSVISVRISNELFWFDQSEEKLHELCCLKRFELNCCFWFPSLGMKVGLDWSKIEQTYNERGFRFFNLQSPMFYLSIW